MKYERFLQQVDFTERIIKLQDALERALQRQSEKFSHASLNGFRVLVLSQRDPELWINYLEHQINRSAPWETIMGKDIIKWIKENQNLDAMELHADLFKETLKFIDQYEVIKLTDPPKNLALIVMQKSLLRFIHLAEELVREKQGRRANK